MGKVISLPPAASSRRLKRSRAAPPVEEIEQTPELADEPPAIDLSDLRLPKWLMPLIRDQMLVAERTFPAKAGWMKKAWVGGAVQHIFTFRELDGQPCAFPPDPLRSGLVDVLIESVWSLEFRVPRVRSALQSSGSTALSEALCGAHIRG